MDFIPQMLVNFSTSSTLCYNGNGGTATFNFTNAVTNNSYIFYENFTQLQTGFLISPSASITLNLSLIHI